MIDVQSLYSTLFKSLLIVSHVPSRSSDLLCSSYYFAHRHQCILVASRDSDSRTVGVFLYTTFVNNLGYTCVGVQCDNYCVVIYC